MLRVKNENGVYGFHFSMTKPTFYIKKGVHSILLFKHSMS